MALSDADYATFRAHMARHEQPGAGVCPICRATQWALDGPLTLQGGSVAFPIGAPVVMATCTRCFHVRFFAWLPIVESQRG